MSGYFNFSSHTMDDWWARRAFLHTFWRANGRDPRWLPPLYSQYKGALLGRNSPHAQRLHPTLLTLDAVPVAPRVSGFAGIPMAGGGDDNIVGMAALLHDERPEVPTTWLGMFNFANDDEVLDRMLDAVWQRAAEAGSMRLAGPTLLAPSFAPGVLLDYYHVDPPLYTPYSPPYMPELLDLALSPLLYTRIFSLETESTPPLAGRAEFLIEPLTPARLAGDLLSLAQVAFAEGPAAAPDALEMEFLLVGWSVAPLLGWTARSSGEDARVLGFVLAQPEVGRTVRRTSGGRSLWGRLRSIIATAGGAERGRVLLGAVTEEARGQGVGSALLGALVDHARRAGWRWLDFGPVAEGSDAEAFLTQAGALPRQRYALFGSEE